MKSSSDTFCRQQQNVQFALLVVRDNVEINGFSKSDTGFKFDTWLLNIL